jgi:hypothetical protein
MAILEGDNTLSLKFDTKDVYSGKPSVLTVKLKPTCGPQQLCDRRASALATTLTPYARSVWSLEIRPLNASAECALCSA